MSYLLDVPVLLYALTFLFGLLVGSFLNVCIYRVPRDISVIAPRSFCPECGKQLGWIDNIPLVSYVIRRSRCRYCSKPIAWRYPLVELTTGGLFVSVVVQHGLTLSSAKWMIFVSLLTVLFWTDLEERILPNEMTLGGSLIGLVLAFFVAVPRGVGGLILPNAAQAWRSLLDALLAGAFLSLPIWLMGLIWSKIRKRQALGFGDVKLLLMLGVFLGPADGLFAVTIGAVAGALVGIVLIIWQKKEAATYELPFGSFLCLGALAVVLWTASAHTPLAVP